MWVCCIVFFSVRKCAGSNGLWYVIRTSELCGLFVFLRDRNMIRCACGNSYVEHDVCMEEQKVGDKGFGQCSRVRGICANFVEECNVLERFAAQNF